MPRTNPGSGEPLKAGRYFRAAESKRHTLIEAMDRYARDILPGEKPTSQAPQQVQLSWWREHMGRLALADVTPAVIGEARDELARGITRSSTPRAPSTVNRYMAVLSHLLTVAMKEWGWVGDNPMRNVTRPREPPGRVRFLSDDERTRLLAACRESKDPYLYTVVVLAISTGMRRSEITDLTWGKVDLGRRVITLLPDDTKTGEARAVTVTEHALELLRELDKVRRIETNYVFAAPLSRADTHRHPIGLEIRYEACRYRRLPLPRPPPHSRVLSRDEWRHAGRDRRGTRPQDPRHGEGICAPDRRACERSCGEDEPGGVWRGQSGGAHHRSMICTPPIVAHTCKRIPPGLADVSGCVA